MADMVWDDDRGGWVNRPNPATNIPSTWTWDDDRGGWKPPPEDSGRFAFVGTELVEIVKRTPSVPDLPISQPQQPAAAPAAPVAPVVPAVKVATPDLVLIKEDLIPVELMTDLIFENIGGQEILSIARNDTINGQNIIYSPIKNLSAIKNQNSPENILVTFNNSPIYFDNYSISLLSHIPEYGSGPDGEIVYLDNSGNLIIDVVGMLPGERVEVQILSSGSQLSDTIYSEES